MIDVQPSVSTDGNERTMAFFLAIRRVPNARHVVITAGRPSGIAATAERNESMMRHRIELSYRTNQEQRQS